jgi:FkbM family methyltransferase
MIHYQGQMVSFAQFGEDVMLRRFFGDQPTGFFIDVGAYDPIVDSVTQHFSLSGWTGINIEPLPELHRKFVSARPHEINLNVALSDHPGVLDLVANRSYPGLSTATPDLAEDYRRRGDHLERLHVPATTLSEIVREHCPGRTVDFLKLDAEGHEAEILGGVDLLNWRPRVIVVEAAYRPETWRPLLKRAAYVESGSDSCNLYLVREEESARASVLSLPPNPDDRFVAWSHVQADRGRSTRSLIKRILTGLPPRSWGQ